MRSMPLSRISSRLSSKPHPVMTATGVLAFILLMAFPTSHPRAWASKIGKDEVKTLFLESFNPLFRLAHGRHLMSPRSQHSGRMSRTAGSSSITRMRAGLIPREAFRACTSGSSSHILREGGGRRLCPFGFTFDQDLSPVALDDAIRYAHPEA